MIDFTFLDLIKHFFAIFLPIFAICIKNLLFLMIMSNEDKLLKKKKLESNFCNFFLGLSDSNCSLEE